MSDPQDEPEPGDYASPPCFMHTLDGGTADARPADPVAWRDVARWRKAERERLIAARMAIASTDRDHLTKRLLAVLQAEIGDAAGEIVSLYWPFRGEPDLRPLIEHVIDRGGEIALPVVVEKAHPLAFRTWAPGEALVRSVWNILVPAKGRVVHPTVVISPVVGFDPGNYRLGYGGGFYDRTLASLPARPRVIGVGFSSAAIPTIYPQPHDIPMDMIVTENGIA
jgi:5-formyltetrahydrofolate cyclo-ligase